MGVKVNMHKVNLLCVSRAARLMADTDGEADTAMISHFIY